MLVDFSEVAEDAFVESCTGPLKTFQNIFIHFPVYSIYYAGNGNCGPGRVPQCRRRCIHDGTMESPKYKATRLTRDGSDSLEGHCRSPLSGAQVVFRKYF